MKNTLTTVKNKFISRYSHDAVVEKKSKSTDINILLNRVKMDKKKESRNKILFSTLTSVFLLAFGVLIF